jgi:hypothetical protein
VIDLALGNYGSKKKAIGAILSEVYDAVANGQNTLAAMGIRAAVEQLMIVMVEDQGSFEKNLNAFHASKYVSMDQRDAMGEMLEVGHAAMHRGYLPRDEDLNLALEIVEGVFAPIFAHREKAAELGSAVPRRVRRK